MRRYSGQKALYEAMSRSSSKAKRKSVLARLRPQLQKLRPQLEKLCQIGKKPARGDVNYTYKKIDTPYSNIMAAYVDDQTIPAGTFYWQLHNMRNTMLTNQPKESHEARADVKVPILDNLSFSAFYKYITRENDDSQDWESYSHMPSASLWYAPLEKLHLNVTYVYSYDKTGALVVVPVFDG